MKVTEPVTIFGSVITATCTTESTDFGTLTGTSTGGATVDLSIILNCGSVLPSARWEGTWTLTTTTGAGHAIGVVE